MQTVIRRFGDNVLLFDGDFAEIAPSQRHIRLAGNEYRIAYHEVEEAEEPERRCQRLSVYLDESR
ncbi:MAG TPA: hypothetical protein VHL09_09085 [Dehalococcoidia bacterium]|nr:hypothetical protein [Dehalococcoidia bacterium]